MVKGSKPGVLVGILGIILLTAVFFQPRPLDSSDQIAGEAKDGLNYLCRIFVKGHYAYVIRRTPNLLNGYLWIFDVAVVGDSIEDTTFTEPCSSDSIPKAQDVFVSGEYLYIAGKSGQFGYPILTKYRISGGCELELADEDRGYYSSVDYTDMYMTGNRAYLTNDSGEVAVFEVSSDTVGYLEDESIYWHGDGSWQGVHVRGRYMYLAAEAGGLRVIDRDTDSNYQSAPHAGYSRDVYNVVCGGKSRTYEATDAPHQLNLWNTDSLQHINLLSSCFWEDLSRGLGVVHVTGYWVYWLPALKATAVIVCSLACNSLVCLDSIESADSLHDFHVVHDGTGHAHIFGVYPDTTDTGVVLWYCVNDTADTIKEYFYGDVNSDKVVNSADSTILHRYVVDGDTVSVNLDACDVNCDGEVNTDDLLYLSNFVYHRGPAPGTNCQFYHYYFGSANGDTLVNSADIAYLINFLFVGGPAPVPMAAGDPNHSCTVNSADVAYLINYVYLGMRAPQQGCAK